MPEKELQLLREHFYKDWTSESTTNILPSAIKLNEHRKHILYENSNYSILSAYIIPIWKLDKKNQNGRIYPYALGEKICNQNPITTVLDGHPSGNNDILISEIIAIAKNPFIENTKDGPIMFAEVYIVDEGYDKKISRMLNLGGNLEQSSSGFGELDNDNYVISETYNIERLCDLLVSDSSYEVSFSKENEMTMNPTNEKKEVKTSKKSNTNYIVEQQNIVEDKANTIIKENKYMTFEDMKIKKDIKKYLKEAKTLTNLNERLVDLNEIEDFFGSISEIDPEIARLKEDVGKEIANTQKELCDLEEKSKELEEANSKTLVTLDEANSKIKELEESVKDKEEKLGRAVKEMDLSKETYNNLKEMYTSIKANKVGAEEYAKLKESLEESEAKLAIAIKELDSLKEADEDPKEDVDVDNDKEPEKAKADKKEVEPEIDPEMKEETDPEDKEDDEEDSEAKDDKEDDDSEMDDEEKEEKKSKKESTSKDKRVYIKGLKEKSSKFSYKRKHESANIERQSSKVEAYVQDIYRRHDNEMNESFKKALADCTNLNEAQSIYFKFRPSLKSIKETIDAKVDTFKSLKEKEERFVESKKEVSHDNIAKGNDWI